MMILLLEIDDTHRSSTKAMSDVSCKYRLGLLATYPVFVEWMVNVESMFQIGSIFAECKRTITTTIAELIRDLLPNFAPRFRRWCRLASLLDITGSKPGTVSVLAPTPVYDLPVVR